MGFLDRVRGRRGPEPLAIEDYFDQSWYEAESGETFPDQPAAIDHYRRVGVGFDASPHPLFEPTLFEARGASPFDTYLAGPHDEVRTHPAVFAGLVEVGQLDPGTVLVLDTSDDGVVHAAWGGLVERWRDVASERQRRRRLDVPGDIRELPATHHLDVPPAPPADDSTLVSIVMPTWNRPDATVRAIESVQAQTWEHWELLVVDDGSTDDTADRVRAAAAADPRIRLIERPHEGVCAARNSALDAMTGGYVAFLDSDNTWLPHFLHDMVATMVDRDLPAAYGTLRIDGPKGTVWRAVQTSPELIRVKNQIDMNVLVVRADVMRQIGGFDPTLRRAVDWDLAVRIVDAVPTTHLPIVGVQYDHDAERTDRITVSEHDMWPHVVRQRYNVDWDAERSRERDPGVVTVVVKLGTDVATTEAQVEVVKRTLESRHHEIVLVDCAAPRRAVTRHAALVALEVSDQTNVVGYPRPMSWAFAADLGAAAAEGERLVVIDHGVVVDAATLGALVDGTGLTVAGPLESAQAFAIEASTFFEANGLDATMHQALEVADLAARLGTAPTIVPAAEVVTPRTSVYADQVQAEFERRHGTRPHA